MQSPSPATLGDVVWHDVNGDGTQDGGEPGIAGLGVALHHASDMATPLATTTTDAVGIYGFEGLDAALSYVVSFRA